MDVGGGGAGRGGGVAAAPAAGVGVGVGEGRGGGGGFRLNRTKFGIAMNGAPPANFPFRTTTPPSRSGRHSVVSGALVSTACVMSWSTCSMLYTTGPRRSATLP